MELPASVQAALRRELDRRSPGEVVAATRSLSERYRRLHGRSEETVIGSALDALAYTAYRLPATLAALDAVLREARARRPDFQPLDMLDAGAGPGTAAHAAAGIWTSLVRITAIERDSHLIRIGKELAAAADSEAVRGLEWQTGDLGDTWTLSPRDLTVAAYLLGEFSDDMRAAVVDRLWRHTTGVCVIVEPGTPRGHHHIRQATEQLTAAGAYTLAPFPADWTCLEHPGDWCHFSVRVPRTRLLRAAKDASLAYEDERFSYLVAARAPGLPIAARVIRHPQVRSGHVRLVLCTAGGVRQIVISRRQGAVYRQAKRLAWGDAISTEEAGAYALIPSGTR